VVVGNLISSWAVVSMEAVEAVEASMSFEAILLLPSSAEWVPDCILLLLTRDTSGKFSIAHVNLLRICGGTVILLSQLNSLVI
jgi:hypothetical protein